MGKSTSCVHVVNSRIIKDILKGTNYAKFIEHMCVLALCVHNHPIGQANDKNPPSAFFFFFFFNPHKS